MRLPPIVSPGSTAFPEPLARAIYTPTPRSSFGAFRLFGGAEPPTLTLMQQVAVAVVERIVDGRYAAASPLSEHALAAEFGVSKAPVSEALLWVEAIGLLTNASRRSAQVAPMSRADYSDLIHYWDLLLPAALAGFIGRHGPDEAAILRRYGDELDTLAGDDQRTFAFNEIVNRSILYAALHSGLSRIGRALCLLSLQVLRYNNLAFHSAPARNALLREWHRVHDRIERRDEAGTRAVLDELRVRRLEFAAAAFEAQAAGAS